MLVLATELGVVDVEVDVESEFDFADTELGDVAADFDESDAVEEVDDPMLSFDGVLSSEFILDDVNGGKLNLDWVGVVETELGVVEPELALVYDGKLFLICRFVL